MHVRYSDRLIAPEQNTERLFSHWIANSCLLLLCAYSMRRARKEWKMAAQRVSFRWYLIDLGALLVTHTARSTMARLPAILACALGVFGVFAVSSRGPNLRPSCLAIPCVQLSSLRFVSHFTKVRTAQRCSAVRATSFRWQPRATANLKSCHLLQFLQSWQIEQTMLKNCSINMRFGVTTKSYRHLPTVSLEPTATLEKPLFK